MKTFKEWFELLPKDIAQKAIENTNNEMSVHLDRKIGALSSALSLAFNWTETDEGFGYWYDLFVECDKQEESTKENEFVYNWDNLNLKIDRKV
jgi:hypothetical protein